MIDCAERMVQAGRMPDAHQRAPAVVMDTYWRFRRVNDMIRGEDASMIRVATNGEAKDWKLYDESLRPVTQEIDAPEIEKPAKARRRITRTVTIEELENE